MISLNDQNYDSVVSKSDKPVLIDFSATWCGPCKMLTPLLERLSTEMNNKLKICKVDIDEPGTGDIVTKFAIHSVPTLILIKNNLEVSKQVGSQSESALKAWLTKNGV